MAKSGKQKAMKKERIKHKHEKKTKERAAKEITRKARRERKLQKRLEQEAAAGPQRSLLSTFNPDQIAAALEPKKKPQLLQPIPPPALFDLVHEFLKSYRYIKAAHGLRTDHQKRPGHNLTLWVHRSEGYPGLMEIFQDWMRQNPGRVDEGAYAKGEEKRAAERKVIKQGKIERLRIQLGQDPKNDEPEQAPAESGESDESASDSDDDGEGDWTSESGDDDAMSVDEKEAPATVKPAAPPVASTTAPSNKLKRKAPSPSSSSDSDSDKSSSESESEQETKHVAAPAKKKAKTAAPAAESSSSSSESESDSESETSDASSTSGVAVSKAVDASFLVAKPVTTAKPAAAAKPAATAKPASAAKAAPTTKAVPIADSSSSESSESSSSESGDDSDKEEPKTATSTQPTSVSRSSSDSSATLPLGAGVTLKVAKPVGKATRDSSSSSSSASTSSSSSSSSSSEDDESPVKSSTKAAAKSTTKIGKTPKPPKDTLIYYEPASRTQLKKDPLAVGPEKKVPATAVNFKKLKKQHIPFSRIPADVQVDERFASNKYVSYDYADKAHNDLIVTKGKNFTKAKNKGKKGSYRGGQIDTSGVRAIKFDD